MMNFGLYTSKHTVKLIDMSVGEILASGEEGVQRWLKAYEDNYTLVLLN